MGTYSPDVVLSRATVGRVLLRGIVTFGCPLIPPVLAIDTIIANGALVPLVRYVQQRIVPVGPRARSRFVCNLAALHVQIKPVRAFRYLSGGIDDFFNERKHSSYPSR